jgi:hypothetical protein
MALQASVAEPEPDPQGSRTFGRSRVRIHNTESYLDTDPAQILGGDSF